MERKSTPTQAPLHKAERERLERKAAYEHSKKDLVKWEPLVKRNREAPTMFFNNDVDLGFSTVGAIASEFEPRTEFEKKIASLVHDDEVLDAHSKDGSRLLEFNKVWRFRHSFFIKHMSLFSLCPCFKTISFFASFLLFMGLSYCFLKFIEF